MEKAKHSRQPPIPNTPLELVLCFIQTESVSERCIIELGMWVYHIGKVWLNFKTLQILQMSPKLSQTLSKLYPKFTHFIHVLFCVFKKYDLDSTGQCPICSRWWNSRTGWETKFVVYVNLDLLGKDPELVPLWLLYKWTAFDIFPTLLNL